MKKNIINKKSISQAWLNEIFSISFSQEGNGLFFFI